MDAAREEAAEGLARDDLHNAAQNVGRHRVFPARAGLERQRQRRKGIDHLVVLTADHGGQDVPERRRLQGVPGAIRVDSKLTAKDIGAAVGAQLGLKGPVLYGEGSFGDMYVDRSLSPADQAKAKAAAVAAFRAHPQVEAVFTREQLAAAPSPTKSPDQWTMIDKARASFDPERSGDFVVLLKRDVQPVPVTTSYVATHGSPWDYDRRVPILFWRRGMPHTERNESIETVDIMPTLAAAIGLAVDQKSIDGKCLAERHRHLSALGGGIHTRGARLGRKFPRRRGVRDRSPCLHLSLILNIARGRRDK